MRSTRKFVLLLIAGLLLILFSIVLRHPSAEEKPCPSEGLTSERLPFELEYCGILHFPENGDWNDILSAFGQQYESSSGEKQPVQIKSQEERDEFNGFLSELGMDSLPECDFTRSYLWVVGTMKIAQMTVTENSENCYLVDPKFDEKQEDGSIKMGAIEDGFVVYKTDAVDLMY